MVGVQKGHENEIKNTMDYKKRYRKEAKLLKKQRKSQKKFDEKPIR
jgi:hypothetical protein